jgi:hypothetical protein
MNGLKHTVMEIIEAGLEEYKTLFAAPYHFFNTAAFNQLNATKAETVVGLLFKSGKVRLGLIAGRRNDVLISPFSAPFGGFSPSGKDVAIEHLDDAFSALDQYLVSGGYRAITLTLPPLFYHESFLSKCISSALRNGFVIGTADLNHAFFCEDFTKDYLSKGLERNARKNLRNGFDNGLIVRKSGTPEEDSEAYRIIALNRRERGYPLRMSFGQVQATSELVSVDYFLVLNGNQAVASAIVYHVSPGIVQVIYWGDDPVYSVLRPMNVLAFELFRFYAEAGIAVVDIGPSTEHGEPSYGLARFKESIGCRVYLKFTLEKQLTLQ